MTAGGRTSGYESTPLASTTRHSLLTVCPCVGAQTFCTTCGTPMASNLYKAGLMAFFVPSIRSGDVGPPKSHIYCNEKAPEVQLTDELPKFSKGPGSDRWTGA